jgi:transposase
MSLIELTTSEHWQLHELLRRTNDAHLYRHALALLLADAGEPGDQVAGLLGVHRSNVYHWIEAFAAQRDPRALADQPGRGRPSRWGKKQRSMPRALPGKSPQKLGYLASQWSVPLLTEPLRQCGIEACSRSTLRRQIELLDWSWKRGRHVLEPDPEKEKKTDGSGQAHASPAPQCGAFRG